MKVLHIIPTLSKGGAERLVVDICNECNSRKNCEAKILLLHNQNDFSSQLRNTTVIHTTSSFRLRITGKSISDFADYKKVAAAFKPDIIHSHLFEAELFTRENLFPHVRYFSHLHDNMKQFEQMHFGHMFSKKNWSGMIEKSHLIHRYRRCKNHFIANSKHTEAFFKKNLPSDLVINLTHIPNAIDIRSFPLVRRNPVPNQIRLITIGSLVPKKNHAFLFRVMEVLIEKNFLVQLTILGGGPLQAELKMKAERLGILPHILFQGPVNDVATYLTQADVYVHSAIYEPFGLSILEAMATGLPVVAHNGGGNSEFIMNGKEGFILDDLDPVLFAEKILEVVTSKDIYQQFSNHAHSMALHFAMEQYFDRLILLYENA